MSWQTATAIALSVGLLAFGLWWFNQHASTLLARSIEQKGNTMDHNLLRSLMLESHDLRMTSTQAGELVAEFNRIQAMLDEAQNKNTELAASAATLKHVCMELSGAISEYRDLPCDSLQKRMFDTELRYRRRINETPQYCLAAHDAEVAAKTIDEYKASIGEYIFVPRFDHDHGDA